MQSDQGSNRGFFAWLIDLLFGRQTPEPTRQPDGPPPLFPVEDEPLEPLALRVLVIVYDPVVDRNGLTLSRRMGWNRVDDLVAGYIADITECSGGLVNYQVVERVDVPEFPAKARGFRYDANTYLAVQAGRSKPFDPDLADYDRILADFNLVERANQDEFDEVWLFGFPYAGFYESRMVGSGAFWCNAPAMDHVQRCPRRFVVMGFNYERGVGEMLEDLGHRAESILDKVFEHEAGDANLWGRFKLYDKVAPGRAEVGMMHFAPNSEADYDWGNRRLVPSRCDDWLSFPAFQNIVRDVNCADWGNGDIRLHHKWWFKRLPKAPGRINGISNNWWKYVIRVDDPFFESA